jgi:hypothetical protein
MIGREILGSTVRKFVNRDHVSLTKKDGKGLSGGTRWLVSRGGALGSGLIFERSKMFKMTEKLFYLRKLFIKIFNSIFIQKYKNVQ